MLSSISPAATIRVLPPVLLVGYSLYMYAKHRDFISQLEFCFGDLIPASFSNNSDWNSLSHTALSMVVGILSNKCSVSVSMQKDPLGFTLSYMF